jgi:hypothetical protein
MAVSKSKLLMKKKNGVCFYSPPSLPDAQALFFSTASITLLSCLVQLGRFDLFFSLRGYGQTHINKKCMHGLWPALFFCKGE